MTDPKSNDVADESVAAIAVDDTTDETKPVTDGSDPEETEAEAQPG
jgi:hypothetical protein